MPFLCISSQFALGLLTLANLLIPIAILTFAAGFFPYKPFIAGRAFYDVDELALAENAPFNKVIFMVVDALRRCAFGSRSSRVLELIMAATLSTPIIPGFYSLKGTCKSGRPFRSMRY